MNPFHPTGQHLLADLFGIAPDKLSDAGLIEALLRHSALSAGATILHSHFHSFGSGQGITGVLLLAESHISIHTWPENGFAAVDIFMCGASQPQQALELILTAFKAGSHTRQVVVRGSAEKGIC